MNNKQISENFLNLAKEARSENELLSEWNLKVAKVHALLALEEAIRESN